MKSFRYIISLKYDPKTNELRGAEALIRWASPEFGFVTPYRFIPIFEKNGFITEIDHYMISMWQETRRGGLTRDTNACLYR